MSRSPLPLNGAAARALQDGARLAAAVLAGYFAAMAVGLPERFWVVITVLIVMRGDAGLTMDVGRDRARGTVIGALCGLAGAGLQSLGANPVVVTLGVVSLLAFASAAAPTLRTAAVAALIVLGAGELAGYSAIDAAVLRVAQIGIGVGVSVALALATTRMNSRSRFRAGCASLLGRMASHLQTPGGWGRPGEAREEAAAAAVRRALAGLAMLAGSADRMRFRSPGKAATPQERPCRRMAALTGRVVQDVAMLKRVMALTWDRNPPPLAAEAAGTAGLALGSIAGMIAGSGQASLDPLRRLVERCGTGDDTHAAMLAAPLRLLLEDLQLLCAIGTGDTRC